MNSTNYWVAEGEQVTGPFAESQLLPMWRSGRFTARAQCCVEGTEGWMPLSIVANDLESAEAALKNRAEVPTRPRPTEKDSPVVRVREQAGCLNEAGKAFIAAVACLVVLVIAFAMIGGGNRSSFTEPAAGMIGIPDGDATTGKYQELARRNGLQVMKASSAHFIQGRSWHALRMRGGKGTLDVLVNDGSEKWVEISEFIALCRSLGAGSESDLREVEKMRAELD